MTSLCRFMPPPTPSRCICSKLTWWKKRRTWSSWSATRIRPSGSSSGSLSVCWAEPPSPPPLTAPPLPWPPSLTPVRRGSWSLVTSTWCVSESEDFSLALSVPDLSSDKKLSAVPVFNRSVLMKLPLTLVWPVLKVCIWECRQCPGVWELHLDTEDEVKVPESPEDVREAEEARLGSGHSVQRRGELTSRDDGQYIIHVMNLLQDPDEVQNHAKQENQDISWTLWTYSYWRSCCCFVVKNPTLTCFFKFQLYTN